MAGNRIGVQSQCVSSQNTLHCCFWTYTGHVHSKLLEAIGRGYCAYCTSKPFWCVSLLPRDVTYCPDLNLVDNSLAVLHVVLFFWQNISLHTLSTESRSLNLVVYMCRL